MKKIMIDLDDTITTGGYLDIVNKYLNTNLTYENINNQYWVDNIIPKEKLTKYLNYLYNEINFYDYIKINDNAINVIENLSKYYEIFICSAYVDKRDLKNCANLIIHKYNWLRENLPFINPDNFIFTSSKNILKTDIKIDDRLSNLKENADLKLLITAYHNKNISENELKENNVIRVNNWNEIANILLKN